MICGDRQYIADIHQHRICTVRLQGPNSSTNHDMPGPDNQVRMPHQSGEWLWVTRYDMIGPEELYVENTCWDCNEPFPEFQHDNVIPFDPSAVEFAAGEVYKCKKCLREYATIEHRREYTT